MPELIDLGYPVDIGTTVAVALLRCSTLNSAAGTGGVLPLMLACGAGHRCRKVKSR